MAKTVYVVTNPELGWDCVCGVFTTEKKALLSILEYRNEEEEEGNEKDYSKMSTEKLRKLTKDESEIIHTETLL